MTTHLYYTTPQGVKRARLRRDSVRIRGKRLRFLNRARPRARQEAILASIDWRDPVVQTVLHHRVTYVRLVRARRIIMRAQGTGKDGHRYVVQLVLARLYPYRQPKRASE